ncbi:N-acetyltransferase [Kurthia sibirica]|uniref:N-acetyltransferase n=1 Tax=Kurthia sibirica TaxID=202750 RepID=A0A2U3APY7_9BACL|nr:N-acetyltransferase [Kurthia sibirica]PWI26620.1 N-acetyltransferase [Kurthia sibirica]GEK32877.1 hypothetical protein KSI01_04100 [Kurthia sibirica]
MTIITEGFLGDTAYSVRHLSMQDLVDIEALQEKVYAALPDQSVLQPLSTKEFEEILLQERMMLGVFVDDDMIGFRALVEPPVDAEHLGYDCGIAEADFPRVLYQEISNVSPDFRGFGLQKKMAKWSMEHIDISRYDYICSTVKPGNIPSLKDKFSQNLIVRALKIKYVDKLRYVFFKDLTATPKTYEFQVMMDMNDIAGQQQLLQDGYVGTGMESFENQWFVRFEK